MDANNKVFENMALIGREHAWRVEQHKAKRQEIIDKYGWDSEELNDWYKVKNEMVYPFTNGEHKAYRAYINSVEHELNILEVSDLLWETEVRDFLMTLEVAGINELVYTCTSTALMENLYAFEAHGWHMQGLYTITRHKSNWLGEDEDIRGIKFTSYIEA